MHPVARRGFDGTVEAYRRSRPTYPPDAVAWLVEALGIGGGSVVVDLGAGTGIFTRLLVPTGAQLVAVEPLPQMRAALTAELPNVRVIDGTAESLPLNDASADAIISAQSFHWFDLSRAVPELHRALRPGGRLAAIWNEMDTRLEWVAAFNAIIAVPREGSPHPAGAGTAQLGDWFGPLQRRSFEHVHVHDQASLRERVTSMSFVAVQPPDVRTRIFADIGALLDGHPQLAGRATFELPYVTHAWWAESLPVGGRRRYVNST
ncbi:class I SAM-dependent methyltransferase [soil metagenome]